MASARHSHQVSHYFAVSLSVVLLCVASAIRDTTVDHALRDTTVDYVTVGFSTSAIGAVDTNGVFLYSHNKTFALGFCGKAAADLDSYYLCILHLPSSQDIWYANRNRPVERSDVLDFKTDGSVEIRTSSGEVVWSTGVGGGSTLQLLETGNLVLLEDRGKVLWQSFDHPTDTLLTGQIFNSKMKLISGKSGSDVSEGAFYLSMDELGLALYNNFSSPQVYWTMAKDGDTNIVNPGGVAEYAEIVSNTLQIMESNLKTVVSNIILDTYTGSTIRRATLEADGNLKVYTYSPGLWSPAFAALGEPSSCNLPTTCGEYGICGVGGQCSCPDFSEPKNSTNLSQGCSVSFAGTCNGTTASNHTDALILVGNVNYYGNTYTQPEGPLELDACKQMCSGNCSCVALFFQNDTGSCFLWDALGTLMYDGNNNHFAFLRSSHAEAPRAGRPQPKSPTLIISVIVSVTAFIILGLLVGAGALFMHKKKLSCKQQPPPYDDDDDLLDAIPGLPTRFSYKELDAVTSGFKIKLGAGGFGSVYEGILGDGTKVAVKRLESFHQGKKEFRAEVATIGSIHHVHLVRLRGFCAEGTHRLLVYEFMANGSLAKLLFSTNKGDMVLDWNTRCKISVATARGLAYLHDDCRERIIHCDIKPENILLDDNLVAKVSDFGLAKLVGPEQSEVFTTMRGTRGYLAPEWLLNSPISDKSDVYSFGMVLLEIISGRKNFDANEVSDKLYFPIYAFRQVEAGNGKLLADPRLNGTADEEQVATLIRIALWCIQDEVARRPSMKKIIKMLDGIVEVPQPPLTPQLAYRLHGGKFDSGNDSGISDFDSGGMSASRLSGPR